MSTLVSKGQQILKFEFDNNAEKFLGKKIVRKKEILLGKNILKIFLLKKIVQKNCQQNKFVAKKLIEKKSVEKKLFKKKKKEIVSNINLSEKIFSPKQKKFAEKLSEKDLFEKIFCQDKNLLEGNKLPQKKLSNLFFIGKKYFVRKKFVTDFVSDFVSDKLILIFCSIF